ncbi:GATA-type zinc finger protein 1 [Brachyhypopomus gauderio]|uniref:GATA-type zinc finger protein 1 n=1 Tax=Brachyhypopomus gauderio TaxID=698409 RepID=UPI00404270C4
MSSGADTQDDLTNSPQSARENLGPEDPHVTPSSILYLLQEATKLASPANQHLDAKGIDDDSKEISGSSCSSAPLSQKVSNTNPQPSLTGVLSMLNSVQASCPWEVMSLINLQCERLLHPGQSPGEDGDPCSGISDNTEAEYGNAMECTSCPSAVLPDPISPNVSFGRVSAENDVKPNVCYSVMHIIDGTDQLLVNQSQDNTSAKHKAIDNLAELIAENTGCTLPSTSESSENCFHVETSELPLVANQVDLCDLPPKQSNFHIVEEQGKMVSASSSDTPRSPASEIRSVDFTSTLAFGDSSKCCTFNAYDGPQPEITAVSTATPQASRVDGRSLYTTDLNNNQEGVKDKKPQDPEDSKTVSSTEPRCRRRTPRKQAHPARSPDLQEPELQGVTFNMQTELDHSTDQCRLLITSNYRRGRRSRGSRGRSTQNSQRPSGSEEESDPASLSKKMCASCCTRKTPLWRDAEDGTPLCNACGIRYKKYRVRCLQCWNIPRKEAKSSSKCLKCGDELHVASQNKRAGW